MASEAPPQDRDHFAESLFDRATDPCIARINCSDLVDKDSVADALDEIFSELEMENGKHFILKGPTTSLSKKWVLAFCGEGQVPIRR